MLKGANGNIPALKAAALPLATPNSYDQALASISAAQRQLTGLLNTYSDVPTLPKYTTKYLDLGKAVNGAGSFADPYQSSQIAAIYTGDLSKNLLAVKRNSIGTAALLFASIYANPAEPFILCPYGNTGNLPKIDQGLVNTSFVAVNGFSPLYKVTLANYMPIWEAGIRLYNIYPASPQVPGATPYNELINAGPGYMFYGNDGAAYIYMWETNTSPNLGQMVTGDIAQLANPAWGFTMGHGAFATDGNILLFGLASTHSVVSGVSISCAAAAQTVDSVRVVNCDCRNSGISVFEQDGIYEGSGISCFGRNDTFLMTGFYAAGNYSQDVGNNNIELEQMSGALIEFNLSSDCMGHGNTELFSSMSNTVVQFGKSYFPVTRTRSGGPNTKIYPGAGYRAFTLNFAGAQSNATNFNNTVRFELVNDCLGTAFRDDGCLGSRAYNNTFIAQGVNAVIDLDSQNYVTGGTIDFSNNVVVLSGTQAEITAAGGAFYIFSGTLVTNQVIVGDNNYYYASQITMGAGSDLWDEHGTIQTTFSAWVTAVATADKQSKQTNPVLDTNGVPMLDSPARRIGHTAMLDPIFYNFPLRLHEQYPTAVRNGTQRVTPAAGNNIAPNRRAFLLELIPSPGASPLATLTVQFPLSPEDGQEFAVTTSQTITTLTMTEPNGYLVKGAITGLAFAAGSFARWRFDNNDQFWLRVG